MVAPPSVPPVRRVFSQGLVQQIAALRLFMRDFPELNRLIEGYESNDRLLAWAILDCLDDFSNTPPWTGRYSPDNFPYPSLLIRGAAINILESVGLLQTRNQLTFSDGGIQVGVSNKTPLIMNWINLFRQSYERKKKEWKIAENIRQGWGGGVHSDYWYINGYYGSY
jgi:hypothetical protein